MPTPAEPGQPQERRVVEPIRVLRPRNTDALAELFREMTELTKDPVSYESIPLAAEPAAGGGAETEELPPTDPWAADPTPPPGGPRTTTAAPEDTGPPTEPVTAEDWASGPGSVSGPRDWASGHGAVADHGGPGDWTSGPGSGAEQGGLGGRTPGHGSVTGDDGHRDWVSGSGAGTEQEGHRDGAFGHAPATERGGAPGRAAGPGRATDGGGFRADEGGGHGYAADPGGGRDWAQDDAGRYAAAPGGTHGRTPASPPPGRDRAAGHDLPGPSSGPRGARRPGPGPRHPHGSGAARPAAGYPYGSFPGRAGTGAGPAGAPAAGAAPGGAGRWRRHAQGAAPAAGGARARDEDGSGTGLRRAAITVGVCAAALVGFAAALLVPGRGGEAAAETVQPTQTATQAESSSPSTDPDGAGTLREGDSGPEVTDLQQRLLKIPDVYRDGATDGRYDTVLTEAVARFQLWYGIRGDEDGVYGDDTREALESRTGG
ncbi:peptidoglycan-binding protein [Streptomyces sp. NPDC000345]|uniref:peptidoglycan-binding protein n=1 Tax=Streptomyces sp. NPDC000345 TaxID=3364537 RepID=UPI00369D6DAA